MPIAKMFGGPFVNGLIESISILAAELFWKVKTNTAYSMGILMCSCEAETSAGEGGDT